MTQNKTQKGKSADLYRMVMKDHLCPFGLKSLWLLKHEGYAVQDHKLKSKDETESFMETHNVPPPLKPSSMASV